MLPLRYIKASAKKKFLLNEVQDLKNNIYNKVSTICGDNSSFSPKPLKFRDLSVLNVTNMRINFGGIEPLP